MDVHFHLNLVLAALLAGSATALLVETPARRISRAGSAAADNRIVSRSGAARAWLQGRPDAAPLPRRIALAMGAGFAIFVLLNAIGGVFSVLSWGVALLVVPICMVMLGQLEPVRARRRRERRCTDLPHALELMSACLAAGMPLRAAATAVADCFEGPVAEDLQQVLALVNLGTADAEAWNSLRSSPEWRPTVVDLSRSVESGTMMVEVLMHNAREARNVRRATVEVQAKAVGVRSVLPLMVCFMPAFLLVGVIPTVASALLNALP